MGRNGFLERQREREMAVQNASRQTYVQFMFDLIQMAASDRRFNKDPFGYSRLKLLCEGVSFYYDEFIGALSSSGVESDYLREKMDERLLEVVPENKFFSFNERYDYVKELVPLGKEKK